MNTKGNVADKQQKNQAENQGSPQEELVDNQTGKKAGTSRVDVSVEASEDALVINTGTVTDLSTPQEELVDNSLVNVKISYPKDYTGKRFHKDGATVPMSTETAELLIEKGIAKKV